MDLVDDQRWMKVVITDDTPAPEGPLVGSAVIQIDIPWVDVTRESVLPPHPRPKQTVWTATNQDWWGSNLFPIWLENPPTGWGGAVPVKKGTFRRGIGYNSQGPVAGSGWDGPVTSDPLDGDPGPNDLVINTGGISYECQVPGNWRPHFQVHMLPESDDVKMWMLVEVRVGPSAFIQNATWTDFDNDYLRYVNYFEAGTGWNPTGQDEFNLVLDDDSGFPSTGFAVQQGDFLIIKMVGGAYDANGDVIANPNGFQLPLIGMTHMEYSAPIDPPPPEPEPEQATFFSWTAGDISKPVWDAYVGGLPLGTEGRPKGKNTLRKSFSSAEVDSDLYTQRIFPGHNYEVPTMDSAGNLICDRRFEPEQNKHSQIVPGGSGHPIWTYGFYLKPYYDLEISMNMTLLAPTSRSLWESASYVTLIDLHCGSWGPDWTESFQAPVNLYVTSGELQLRCRGSNELNPTRYLYSDAVKTQIPTIGRSYNYRIRLRVAPYENPASSYAELAIDGQHIGRIEGGPIGINYSGASTPGALWLKAGCYTSNDSLFATQLEYLRISEML